MSDREKIFEAVRGEVRLTDAEPIGGFMVPKAAIEDAMKRITPFIPCTGTWKQQQDYAGVAVREALLGALPYLQAAHISDHVHYHVPATHELFADGSAITIRPVSSKAEPSQREPDEIFRARLIECGKLNELDRAAVLNGAAGDTLDVVGDHVGMRRWVRCVIREDAHSV